MDAQVPDAANMPVFEFCTHGQTHGDCSACEDDADIAYEEFCMERAPLIILPPDHGTDPIRKSGETERKATCVNLSYQRQL